MAALDPSSRAKSARPITFPNTPGTAKIGGKEPPVLSGTITERAVGSMVDR